MDYTYRILMWYKVDLIEHVLCNEQLKSILKSKSFLERINNIFSGKHTFECINYHISRGAFSRILYRKCALINSFINAKRFHNPIIEPSRLYTYIFIAKYRKLAVDSKWQLRKLRNLQTAVQITIKRNLALIRFGCAQTQLLQRVSDIEDFSIPR